MHSIKTRAHAPRAVELALCSKDPVKREAAANLLGKRRKIEGFVPLVLALQSEHKPAVQSAILCALKQIGARDGPETNQATLNLGHGPLLEFMRTNLAKPELIKLALDAFGYTGTEDAIISGSNEIQRLARAAGHEESARHANSFYLSVVCAH